MLHLHIKFFLQRINYAVFEQPVTEVCSIRQLIGKWSATMKHIMFLLTGESNEICRVSDTFLWMWVVTQVVFSTQLLYVLLMTNVYLILFILF
jgi:hypothetical protein